MPSIKLLTLNLHCLEEKNIPLNQQLIRNEIVMKNIDIVFLQEVAQYDESPLLYDSVKESNYGYELQQQLKEEGKEYYYYFVDIKHSFNKYNEGVAILSKYMLHDIQGNYISKCTDYSNWKSRKMIKAELHLPNKKISLVSSHLGWTDEIEVFEEQIERMLTHLDKNHIWLLAGDFNVSPKTNEYSFMLGQGLYDLYGSNPKHLYDPTHLNDIDLHIGATRIDYIFSNVKLEVLDREVLFSKQLVSDHFGVYMELKL